MSLWGQEETLGLRPHSLETMPRPFSNIRSTKQLTSRAIIECSSRNRYILNMEMLIELLTLIVAIWTITDKSEFLKKDHFRRDIAF